MLRRNFIVFSYGSIGDFLMTLSVFDNVVAFDPEIRCIVLTTRNEKLLKEIAVGYPHIEIYTLSLKGLYTSIFAYFGLIFSSNFVLIPPTFGVTPFVIKAFARLLSLSPWSMSVGFQDKGYIVKVAYDTLLPFDKDVLFVRTLHNAVEACGIPIVHPTPSYLFEKQDIAPIAITNPYIVLHTFAANEKRSLPQERWVELLRFIKKEFPKYQVIITGGGADKPVAEQMIQAVGMQNILNACGAYTFQVLASVIQDAKLFVGVDTGITHLASVMQHKVLVIGNLSNPCWLPVYNPNATILVNDSRCTCKGDKSGDCIEMIDGKPYYRCMIDIPQKQIEENIKKLING